MPYYIAVEKEEKTYAAVNVKRCRAYSHKSFLYDSPYAYTLKEINNITTTFKDEDELKDALIKVFSLDKIYADKPLVIYKSNENGEKAIKTNILYGESRELIESTSNVVKYIETKYQKNDYIFLKQLEKLNTQNEQIKNIIKDLTIAINISMETKEQVIDNSEKIAKLVQLLISDNKGKADYELFHNLVSTITTYEAYSTKNNTHIKTKKI